MGKGISGAAAPALVGGLLGSNPTLLWLALGGTAAVTSAAYWLIPASTHTRAHRVGSPTSTVDATSA